MAETESSGRSPDIFVSYASRDREQVLAIVERLEAAGVHIWIDRDGISGGASYALEIAEAIEHAKAIVLMCSEASLASRNVKQEIALGWRYEKPYLPLLLEPVEIPKDVAYWLETAQWVEILDQPEPEWLPKLAEALARLGIEIDLSATTLGRERPLLVGRQREQGLLRTQLGAMLQGKGSVVLVGGEAGIGKTTLVDDLTIDAEEAGCLVLWGHAYDLSVTPPYGPWNELFRQYLGVVDATLPPIPPFIFGVEELAKIGSQESLFVQIAEFLQTVTAQRPLMLVLDDLHWFDQASLDFTRMLSRRAAFHRLLIVATYRSDELHRRHPLYTLLPLLVREAGAERLDVHPLDEVGHRALIQSRYALADADRRRLERYLAAHAEGNPLYAGELLRTLEESGALTQHDGRWVVGALERVRVPPMLRQVIEGRLSRLPDEPRELLQLAAVIGQVAPLTLWQQVSGAADEELVAAIEQGQAAQVLIEIGNGTSYQFRHALIREALYEEVVAPRRRLWHRKIGEVLAETHGAEPDSVAYHFLQAGDARAIGWLINAGERAERAYVWSTASERYDAALAKMTEQDLSPIERAKLLSRMAMLLRYTDTRRALALISEAQTLAEAAGERGMASICQVFGGLYRCYLGDVKTGLIVMAQGTDAIETLSGDERVVFVELWGFDQSPYFVGTLAVELAEAGRLEEARNRFTRMLATTPPPGLRPGRPSSTYADGLSGMAVATALLGDLDAARRMFQQTRAAYQAVEHYQMLARTLGFEIDLVQLPYKPENLEMRQHVEAEVVAAGRRAQGANNVVHAAFSAVSLMQLDGRWAEARMIAAQVLEGTFWPDRMLASQSVVPLAYNQGDVMTARNVIAELLPDGPNTEPGGTRFIYALKLQRVALHIALDDQDLPTAHAWLDAHDRWLEWSGAVLGRAEGALGWAEYHLVNRDPASARAAAEQALAHASNPRQPLALLAVHRFLGELDTIDARFVDADAHLRQSLQLAEACAAPFERALTLFEIARLRIAEGRLDNTRQLLAEVRTICEPLQAKPTLARVAELERTLESSGQEPYHA